MVVREMTSRTYLSIGDVLSLLREEFPDVTISKIRFLESQGLVDPERSPSGYRKFYDDDVARLRWVLRKQRDHFLPLKVIRDRLAAAGRGVPPDDEPVGNGESSWREAEETAHPAAALREGPHAVVGAGPQAGSRARNGASAVQARPPAPHQGGEAPAERPGADTSPPTLASARPAHRSVASHPAATAVAERRPDRPRAEPAVESEPAATIEHHPAHEGAAGARREAAGAGAAGAGVAGVAGALVAASAGVAGSAGEVLSPSVSGVSLTLAELCAATGLTPDVVASLEGLGLLAPMTMAGGAFYDEEALTVGKLVGEFGRYGVEPRHLRMYRNAADREAGLVEQVIMPLLRQRNPEARQRAVDAAADLARLGQSMRASLVRTELRRQLGG